VPRPSPTPLRPPPHSHPIDTSFRFRTAEKPTTSGEPSRGANDGRLQATLSLCRPLSEQVNATPADAKRRTANPRRYMACRRSGVRRLPTRAVLSLDDSSSADFALAQVDQFSGANGIRASSEMGTGGEHPCRTRAIPSRPHRSR
jgi:hypothetical protein